MISLAKRLCQMTARLQELYKSRIYSDNVFHLPSKNSLRHANCCLYKPIRSSLQFPLTLKKEFIRCVTRALS